MHFAICLRQQQCRSFHHDDFGIDWIFTQSTILALVIAIYASFRMELIMQYSINL
jgi:hypothetical protein